MNARAIFAADDRDRNTPETLTGQTPLRPRLHHGPNTVLSPVGNETDIFTDRMLHTFAKVFMVDLHEPLRGRAKDDRFFTAPAMRIAVRMVLFFKEQLVLG